MASTYDIWCGVDACKTGHHATAVDLGGTKAHDKELPHDEGKLTALFNELRSRGEVLVIVDQPAHES